MPPRPPSPPGSSFATTFVIGTAAALWFAAALVTGSRETVVMALGWLAILLLSVVTNLRR
jgi:hypothetical protein